MEGVERGQQTDQLVAAQGGATGGSMCCWRHQGGGVTHTVLKFLRAQRPLEGERLCSTVRMGAVVTHTQKGGTTAPTSTAQHTTASHANGSTTKPTVSTPQSHGSEGIAAGRRAQHIQVEAGEGITAAQLVVEPSGERVAAIPAVESAAAKLRRPGGPGINTEFTVSD